MNSEYLDQLKVPENFEISIIASDIESPRQITETEDGHLTLRAEENRPYSRRNGMHARKRRVETDENVQQKPCV